MQAVACCLAGVDQPGTAEWAQADVDAFRNCISGCVLDAFFLGKRTAKGRELIHLVTVHRSAKNVDLNRLFLRAVNRLNTDYTGPPSLPGKTRSASTKSSPKVEPTVQVVCANPPTVVDHAGETHRSDVGETCLNVVGGKILLCSCFGDSDYR